MARMHKANSWWRNAVTGANLQPEHKKRGEQNESTLNSPEFKKACEIVGVPVTRRQASKWRNGKGCAYTGQKYIAPTVARW